MVSGEGSASLLPLEPSGVEQTQHRQKILLRLREWDTPFTVTSLEETIASLVRQGDLALGLALYDSLGLSRGTTFDPATRLGGYLFTKLLPRSLEATVSWTLRLAAAKRSLSEPCLETLLEQIYAEGAAEQMHRLKDTIDWTPRLVEQATVRAFLRAGDVEGVLEMLALAQKRGWSLSQEVWLEIMEVTLQEPLGSLPLHLGRLIKQTTDRRFDRLQALMDDLYRRNIRLTGAAVEALEQVITTTLVPASFLDYLDQYHNRSGYGATEPK